MKPRLLLTALALTAAAATTAAHADWKSELNKFWTAVQQSPQAQQAVQSALSDSDILKGLKEALAKGTTNAINTLGRSDGFWKNDLVRIPLPDGLVRADKTLRKFGMGPSLDQFQLTLNRSAEAAVPQVADIFGNAVRQMTIQDVRGILNGEPDAATQFFKRTTSDAIYGKVLPLVQGATQKVGVTQQYKALMGNYGPMLKMAGVQNTDLDSFVTHKAMDGLFTTIAQEEARIRQDPAARTSEILKKVFGAKK